MKRDLFKTASCGWRSAGFQHGALAVPTGSSRAGGRRSGFSKFSKLLYLTGFFGIVLATTGCAQPTLKQAFQNDFLIGAALNPAQFCESNVAEAALVKRQFNSISPEN